MAERRALGGDACDEPRCVQEAAECGSSPYQAGFGETASGTRARRRYPEAGNGSRSSTRRGNERGVFAGGGHCARLRPSTGPGVDIVVEGNVAPQQDLGDVDRAVLVGGDAHLGDLTAEPFVRVGPLAAQSSQGG
jgi:hypothetical protein